MNETIDRLRHEAQQASTRTYAPYSGHREAATLLLADGTWLPGVRVESASFSLVIPPLVNAFTTAIACGRSDVVAAVLSRAFRPEEAAYVQDSPTGPFRREADDVFVSSTAQTLPAPEALLDPFLKAPLPQTPDEGIALARDVARRAYIPESAFPVGCVLVTQAGHLIPGVNVEHSDWSRVLCAERNALGTARSWGLPPAKALYLTCPRDAECSPCGACRQLLAEHATDATVWMDRREASPEATSPAHLLPGAFNGQGLVRSS